MKCMEIGIIVALLAILLAVWLISVQRRLVVLDENIKNAMSQIGVQLSSWYDATLQKIKRRKKITLFINRASNSYMDVQKGNPAMTIVSNRRI